MTPTRQRHDGTKARFETVSPLMALSTLTRFDRIARNYFSSCSFSRFRISPSINPAIRTAAVIAIAVSASSVQAAEKIVGVPGWTTGTQTYLRARPSAETPAVAKVPRHTKLYVWGKFDGWYRVETSDHTFGWIYHPYVNAPAANKIVELTHKKAKLASNRTANQEMYGSPEVLKNYRETYGYLHKKPEARTRIASSSQKQDAESSTRTSTSTRPRAAAVKERTKVRSQLRTISTRTKKNVVTKAAVETRVARPVDNSATLRAATLRAATLRAAAASAEARRAAAREREAQRVARAQEEARNQAKLAKIATENAERNRAARLAKAQAEEAARANAEKYAYQQRVIAEQKRIAQAQADAKAEANAREVSRKARVARLERERVAREARYKKRLAARAAARQARLARYRTRLAAQQRREKQRQQMMAMQSERSSTSTRSANLPSGADLRPISPQELERARKDYLDGRISVAKNGIADTSSPSPLNQSNTDRPAGFAPSSYVHNEVKQSITVTPQNAITTRPATIPQGLTLPLGNTTTSKTVVTTIASARKQPVAKRVASGSPLASRGGSPRMRAGLRGGSPRDYARYRAQGSLFGQTIAKQALTYRGRPYIMGAASPSRGFDCSGLIYFLLRQRGYNPPRTAAGLSHYGKSVPRNDLQPGDILLFANTYKRGISHAGIYMGNGKFVHAANRKRGVATDAMSSRYWASKYWGARRVK